MISLDTLLVDLSLPQHLVDVIRVSLEISSDQMLAHKGFVLFHDSLFIFNNIRKVDKGLTQFSSSLYSEEELLLRLLLTKTKMPPTMARKVNTEARTMKATVALVLLLVLASTNPKVS